MRRGIVAGVAALLVLAICWPSVTHAATSYTDPRGRFSFAIPDDYAVTDNGPVPAIVTLRSTALRNAYVVIDTFTASTDEVLPTLDDAVAILQDDLLTAAEDKAIGEEGIGTLTLGGVDARRFDYFEKDDSGVLHLAIVIALRGRTLWAVMFRANEMDYPTLISQTQDVLTSFTFLSSTDGTRVPSPTPRPPVPTATSTPSAFPHRIGDG